MTSLSKHITSLQSKGHYFFEKPKVQPMLGLRNQAMSLSLNRLVKKKQLARPRNNFYVIVPVEYQDSGCPPVSWFLDALMGFQGAPYYVGLLSAAALYGAAHQRPYEFQVITNVPLRPIIVGQHRIRFFTKHNLDQAKTQLIKTYTGTMRVSTPEETAFDLLRYVEAAGYLNNVATVLIELAEKLDPKKLVKIARHTENVYGQRLGYLLDYFVGDQLTLPLYQWLNPQKLKPTALRPDKPIQGQKIDLKWHVYVNEDVEPDL